MTRLSQISAIIFFATLISWASKNLFVRHMLNPKASEKSLNKGAIALRKKHFDAGRVKDLTTTEDILFSSSSAAADFVTGYSVSGPASWKNAAGQTLKEIESK